MKQMSHHKIISLIIISSLVIVISLLCLTITKSIISSNILSESPTRYTEKLRFLGHSQIVSEKCEIIITFDDKNYINQLKLNLDLGQYFGHKKVKFLSSLSCKLLTFFRSQIVNRSMNSFAIIPAFNILK